MVWLGTEIGEEELGESSGTGRSLLCLLKEKNSWSGNVFLCNRHIPFILNPWIILVDVSTGGKAFPPIQLSVKQWQVF